MGILQKTRNWLWSLPDNDFKRVVAFVYVVGAFLMYFSIFQIMGWTASLTFHVIAVTLLALNSWPLARGILKASKKYQREVQRKSGNAAGLRP